MSDLGLRIAVTSVDVAIMIICVLCMIFSDKTSNQNNARRTLLAIEVILACNIAMIWKI